MLFNQNDQILVKICIQSVPINLILYITMKRNNLAKIIILYF